MTTKRGLPLNERADFIELSRRAGKASAIARAKKKERAQKIAEAEAALF